MQNGEHGAVARGVEKFVGVPACSQRTRFRLAVADDASHQQVPIVERRAIGVSQGVAEFPAFMNRARRFRRDVAWNAASKRKLSEKALQAGFARRNLTIDLAVGSFEVGV